MIQQLPTLDAPVLSTLNASGSRRWLNPRLSRGKFHRARQILAYVLIAIFTLLPYIPIHGKPAILLDITQRQFTLFGFTFLPTDTLLLALFLVTTIVGICLATAAFGRVWCGWMCPQTVYLEFVYRPIERLLDGPPGPRHSPGRKSTPARRVIKYVLYLLISMYLAHTFLAYFVGVEALSHWVRRSPIEHPISFLVMVAVTGLMVFDFSYFREQTCIVACPYGRFQSVMIDRQSMIVSYDARRGEPRAKPSQRKGAETKGDCIDCGLCTDTCPTGIDIRAGLQMECVGCTQCIDACDDMMTRVGKPTGLIRFSSQARMAGEVRRLFRPRLFLYAGLMIALATTFLVVLANKQTADVTLLRGLGAPFVELTPGQTTNQVRIKIRNRGENEAAYRIETTESDKVKVGTSENPVRVAAGEARTVSVLLTLPREAFRDGLYDVKLRLTDGHSFTQEIPYRLLGPRHAAPSHPQ